MLLTMVAIPGLSGQRLLLHVLAGTIALAAFSRHLYERPFIRRAHDR